MKTQYLLATGLFLSVIFSTQSAIGNQASHNPPDTLRLESTSPENNDSIQYELIILDPGFESWFIKTHKSEHFYSQGYLENWNLQLVTQWNASIGMGARGRCNPEVYIHYDMSVDYGKTINHRLFYYFRYVNEYCRLFSNYPGTWN